MSEERGALACAVAAAPGEGAASAPRRAGRSGPKPRRRLPPGPSAVAALALALAGARATGAPPASPGPTGGPPLPISSLLTDSTARFVLYAPDAATLQKAHRDLLGAANQFRRCVGEFPPPLMAAVLGTLPDPARVDHAALRAAGVTLIADDWPPPPGLAEAPRRTSDGRAAPPRGPMPLVERAGRAYLREYERLNARSQPPAGRARLVPDWFEAAIGGLALPLPDQNSRLRFLRDRLEQHIPLERLFTMARPATAGGATSDRAPRGAAGGNTRSAGRRPGTAPARTSDTPEIFDSESLALARFIAARESEGLVGKILLSYLSGQPETMALNAAKSLYPRPDLLEKEWLDWMRTQDFPR